MIGPTKQPVMDMFPDLLASLLVAPGVISCFTMLLCVKLLGIGTRR